VPSHAAFVDASPYTVRVDGRRAALYREDELIGPVTLPPRPRIYDLETADGVPYWKIALLHLDSIASTVVQKCIYWDTPEQCGFCGIELTRGEQTVPVKTPAMLAEVCTAARDLDHAVDVTLTTGSLNRRDRGAIYISRCAHAIKEACGLPIQVQFEPPDDPRVLAEVHRAGVDAVGIHIETFDPDVLARVAPGKAQCGVEGYFRMWEAAVDVFGVGSVTTYVLLGMGERPELIVEGCRRAIAMGVYPFVVPLRPVPGTLMADARPPEPDYVASIYAEVSAMLADAGLDHMDAKAGCARCQACSGLSAWERVLAREDGDGALDILAGARR
jgi:radical SAM protein (TIGR04043 family)